jgi:hypothetical protein
VHTKGYVCKASYALCESPLLHMSSIWDMTCGECDGGDGKRRRVSTCACGRVRLSKDQQGSVGVSEVR